MISMVPRWLHWETQPWLREVLPTVMFDEAAGGRALQNMMEGSDNGNRLGLTGEDNGKRFAVLNSVQT